MWVARAPKLSASSPPDLESDAFDFFSLHICASLPECKAADVFRSAITPRNADISSGRGFQRPCLKNRIGLHFINSVTSGVSQSRATSRQHYPPAGRCIASARSPPSSLPPPASSIAICGSVRRVHSKFVALLGHQKVFLVAFSWTFSRMFFCEPRASAWLLFSFKERTTIRQI